jgi:septal ring factor EnvC (AmiA/AmiB activator)
MPNLKLFAEEESRIAADRNKDKPDFGRFRIPLLRSITEPIRAVSVWKLSFVLVTAAFVVSIYAYMRVSMDRKIQQEKLQQAYESINKLITKYEDTRQQARLYEFDMMSWQSEAERSKKALFNSEAELQNARKSLYEARKDLETMQQYNTETLKELNEKISRIRSHIPNIGEKTTE